MTDDPAVGAEPVVVVGAGIAGLLAARELAGAGLPVTVVDKGRGVGGRMATRRVGGARLDHGAQFFTVRAERFGAEVDRWLAAGAAREWCRGFRQPEDGHPRYVGAAGMTSVPKALAAGVDVRLGATASAVAPDGNGRWRVEVEGSEPVAARAVVLTPPAPQSLALLRAGGAPLPHAAWESLGRIRFDPCLAALVVLDSPAAVPSPGGVQVEGDGLLGWVGDNAAKGVSAAPALTLHARGPESSARWDEPPASTLAAMIAAAAPWLGDAGVLDAQLARWRYAQPTVWHPERFLVAVDGPAPVVCAGDAFGEARVEGAALSGWAAAGAVIERLGD